jgi:hypothetical protein
MDKTRDIEFWFHLLSMALSFGTNTCESKDFIEKGVVGEALEK